LIFATEPFAEGVVAISPPYPTNYEKALSFPPTHSSMVRNIFRKSGLFFINEKGGVRVADDERVEVE
jgi:hypothetical protein